MEDKICALSNHFLTSEEERLIKDTLEIVMQDQNKHAINIFMALFKAKPEYQQLFKNFRNTPYAKLPTDPKLVSHANNILRALTQAVLAGYQDIFLLQNVFIDVAKSHLTRQVGPDHVRVFVSVLMEYLTQQLGDLMTTQRVNAWTKVLEKAVEAFEYVSEDH